MFVFATSYLDSWTGIAVNHKAHVHKTEDSSKGGKHDKDTNNIEHRGAMANKRCLSPQISDNERRKRKIANPSLLLYQAQVMEFRKCDEFMNLIKEDKSEVGEEDRSRISSSSESFISSSYLSYTKSFGSSTDESYRLNSSILGDKDKDHWEAVRKCSADTTNDISEIETDLDDVGFEDEKIQQNDAKNRVSKENQERKC